MTSSVTLSLSTDESLVLFDWLARTRELGAPAPFIHQAEQRVLWDVECHLESSLDEILTPTYSQRLDDSRRRVADIAEG